MKTVEDLRKAGFRVFVKHSRYYEVDNLMLPIVPVKNVYFGPITRPAAKSMGYVPSTVFPRGGKTEVEIYHRDRLCSEGHAVCSINDNFNRKIGLTIALGRALERLDMINWDQVLAEVGQERLRSFCDGKYTRRQLESCGTTARSTVRALGVKEMRTRARKALNRRTAS